jgi:dipeptidyl aminopeptidase/acylaminoacyl peptidase
MTRKQAPFGSWKSPITADLITSSTIGLGQIFLDGSDIYWSESRPSEKGRNVIVRQNIDGIVDITPKPFNSRTRVHEYGGGSYFVVDGTVYFSNFADQRLYSQTAGNEPQPITSEAALRYGDGIFDRQRQRIICVCEDHTVANSQADSQPTNTLISLSLDGNREILVSGNDFYTSPHLSPDSSRLAWLTWNHPNMPWDGTELWVGDIQEDGSIGNKVKIAGAVDESIFQPEWSPDGILYFISDRTGWWNIYRWNNDSVEAVTNQKTEFGKPQWSLGMSTYGFESPEQIICSYCSEVFWHLASIDIATGQIQKIDVPYTEINSLKVAPGKVIFNGASPSKRSAIVCLDLITKKITELRRSSEVTIEDGYYSYPIPLKFPTEDDKNAYALLYPPANKDYSGTPGENTPLIVNSHGGPTAAAHTGLDYGIQFWTSRGFAVLDVNYRGSTGYGTEYRRKLNGKWGIADVEDCVNGALFCADEGLVDGNRLAISGGSAGGYTTLCALVFTDTFKAGASHYGVSDLEALAKDTHKFESRYLDGLVGPYPEKQEIYKERSPIYFTDRLTCPLIFFQGLEDKIVPPNQAETMVEALRKKGLPVAYVPFEGEQHGFRKAENIKRSLEGELYFYSRVFGFEVADDITPVEIENL